MAAEEDIVQQLRKNMPKFKPKNVRPALNTGRLLPLAGRVLGGAATAALTSGAVKGMQNATDEHKKGEWSRTIANRPLAARIEDVEPTYNIQSALGELGSYFNPLVSSEEHRRRYPEETAGLRSTGAFVKPSQQAEHLAGQRLVMGDPRYPTNVGEYMTIEDMPMYVEPPPPPQDKGEGGEFSAIPKWDYPFNKQTRKFEAKPYRSKRPKYRTVWDELGGTNLRGYGGLVAIMAAAQGAKSYNRGLNLREKYAQEEAQSDLDWTQEGRMSDQLALDESMAPYEAARKQSLAESSAINTELLKKAVHSKDPAEKKEALSILGLSGSEADKQSAQLVKALELEYAKAYMQAKQMGMTEEDAQMLMGMRDYIEGIKSGKPPKVQKLTPAIDRPFPFSDVAATYG